MVFFLEKTWLWWVLTALVATLLTWLVVRWQDRRAAAPAGAVAVAGHAAGTASAAAAVEPPAPRTTQPAEAARPAGTPPARTPAIARSVLTPARGLSLRSLVGGDPELAALRAEVEVLRRKADEGEMLRTQMVSVRIDAERAKDLQEEVRLLRLRLEGEDGQVAVLKRRIALLEAEASRVPDLERQLVRAGHATTTRTLGQVVEQAAELGDEVSAPDPDAPAPEAPAPDAPAAPDAAAPALIDVRQGGRA